MQNIKCGAGGHRVVRMSEIDLELLNTVYREIADKMGIEAAVGIYEMFRGQQICFPVRFYSHESLKKEVIKEYDGKNIRALSVKYNYSEKTIRRIIRENKE